mmetsp:Transcript_3098/g.9630  ORF Transcript_3098/g.9630 Transcript_3098/m.9630 type:complete len:248 (+) Transcript_3098:170-913(+)
MRQADGGGSAAGLGRRLHLRLRRRDLEGRLADRGRARGARHVAQGRQAHLLCHQQLDQVAQGLCRQVHIARPLCRARGDLFKQLCGGGVHGADQIQGEREEGVRCRRGRHPGGARPHRRSAHWRPGRRRRADRAEEWRDGASRPGRGRGDRGLRPLHQLLQDPVRPALHQREPGLPLRRDQPRRRDAPHRRAGVGGQRRDGRRDQGVHQARAGARGQAVAAHDRLHCRQVQDRLAQPDLHGRRPPRH